VVGVESPGRSYRKTVALLCVNFRKIVSRCFAKKYSFFYILEQEKVVNIALFHAILE